MLIVIRGGRGTLPARYRRPPMFRGRQPAMILALGLVLGVASISNSTTSPSGQFKDGDERPPGMVWIPGGEFLMGTDEKNAWNTEKQAHRVRLDGFWMDTTEVTNAQFRAFVTATNYKTIAERPVDWEELKKQVPPGTPKPPDAMLQPGSMV